MNKIPPAWLGYMLLLHVVIAFLVVKGDFIRRAEVRLGMLQEADSPFIDGTRGLHKWMDPHVPAGATLFLGDSITQALAAAAVAPLAVNYGISGQRSDQLLRSMDLYAASLAKARIVVVTIGTNDLVQGRSEGIEQRYRAILRKIPATVTVVVSGVPPSSVADASPVVLAAKAACSERPRCIFLDPTSELGKPGMLLDDGIHLSPAGYTAWMHLLKAAWSTADQVASAAQQP